MGRIVLWMLGAGLAAAAITFGIGLLIFTYGHVNQAEGAWAMGLIFFVVPAAFVAGAVIGLIVALIRRRAQHP